MQLLKTKNKTFKFTPAVFFSLFFHASVLTIFLLSPAKNAVTQPSLGGLNLVWVSLGSGANENHHITSGQKASPVSIGNKKQKDMGNSGSRLAVAAVHTEAQAPNPSNLSDYSVNHAVEADGSYGNITTQGSGNQAAGGVSSGGSFTAFPLFGENRPPVYPEVARLRGYEGLVLIAAEILPNGRVGNVKIRKSSGFSILDQSALDAVKPWRFEPAKKSGRPFTMWVEVPIKFLLQNDKTSS